MVQEVSLVPNSSPPVVAKTTNFNHHGDQTNYASARTTRTHRDRQTKKMAMLETRY